MKFNRGTDLPPGVADLPDGIEPAHSHWGEPKSDVKMASAVGGVSPAENAYIPYGTDYVPMAEVRVADRIKRCRANDDTCKGWRAHGTDYCPGHLGLLNPKGRIASATALEERGERSE